MGLLDWFRRGPKRCAEEQLAEARALARDRRFEDALRVYTSLRSSDRTPTVLAEIGMAYLETGNRQMALSHASEALRADPRCAGAICVRAEVLLREGQKSKAIDQFREASSIDPECELARRRVGERVPPLPEAQLRPASSTRRDPTDSLSESHPNFAQSLNHLASLLHETGRYDEAEPLYRQALQVRRAILGESHPDFATSLNNLAGLLYATGRYDEAEPLYRQALQIRRDSVGESHPNFATGLNNLAALLQATGRSDEAEPLCRQALQISRNTRGESHPDFATSLNNLAELLQTMGRYDEAEPLYRQALQVRRDALGESHPNFAQSLNNLANLLEETGRDDEAEPLYRQALQISRNTRGESHPDFATCLNNLAGVLQRTGRSDEAEPLCRQVVQVYRDFLGESHPDFATSLNNLAARIAVRCPSEAADLTHRAFRIEDQHFAHVFPICTDAQRLNFLKQFWANLNGYLSLISQHLATDPTAIRDALDIVLRRKALTAEVQIALRQAIVSGHYPHLHEPLQHWHGLLQQVARRTIEGPRPDEPAEQYRQALAALQGDCDRLETELAAQVPEVRLQKQLQAADRGAVALRLPEAVNLIEFVCFRDFDFQAVAARGERPWKPARYLAFILPSGRPDDISMIDLGEAGPIDDLIESFRQAVEQGGDGRRGLIPVSHTSTSSDQALPAGSGIALRKLVFDPLSPALGGCSRLLISPDGGLTRLPFEVLPADAPDRCLIDDYRITYTPTGRDVLRLAEPAAPSPEPAVVVGDPDFDLGRHLAEGTTAPAGKRSAELNRAGLHFGPLPGTEKEAIAIARLLGVQPILKQQALEAALKTTRAPGILHLATHGFFLRDQEVRPSLGLEPQLPAGYENPLLRSGLALAGANWRSKNFVPPEDAEDGMLTAQDVTGMDLTGTELVVLSACDTGLGAVHNGEGVFGLRRSFILAGARTLVMSLWKVPDAQTQELMIDFYQRILAGQPRGEALRQAQLSMKAKHPQPRYWGAFICQGDPGPLARNAQRWGKGVPGQLRSARPATPPHRR